MDFGLFAYFVLAVLTEKVTLIIKDIIPNTAAWSYKIDRLVAIIVGLVLAFAAQLNVLDALGVKTVAGWVGVLLTGLIISRGANYVHDILGLINKK